MPCGPLVECLAVLKDRVAVGGPLPAPDGNIDIQGIDLDAVAPAVGTLRGKDRRAAAAKGINNDVVLLCNVEQGVRDERDGRMQLICVSPCCGADAEGLSATTFAAQISTFIGLGYYCRRRALAPPPHSYKASNRD